MDITLRHRSETHRLIEDSPRHTSAFVGYGNLVLIVFLLDSDRDALSVSIDRVVNKIR
jgi:hypothetical protein